MTRPLRHYFMALFGRRRTPTRVPKAKQSSARLACKEWWEVTAPSALEARKLCQAWPSKVSDGDARITNHGKNRS